MKIALYDENNALLREYTLALAGRHVFTVGLDELRRAGRRLKIAARLPIVDIHGFWHPGISRPSTELLWNIELASAFQKNFPCMVFFEQGGRNRALFGVTDLADDALFTARMNQETACYDLKLEIVLGDAPEAFDCVVDFSGVAWPEAVAAYRRQLGVSAVFPEAAWQPVYCTWYAVHAALTMEYLERNADLAAELGFGTFIVDDGWCFDRLDRVTPETLHDWYRDVGDWKLAEAKLPAFRGHVRRVQGLGMRYLLWVAPFFLGVSGEAYAAAAADEANFITSRHEGQRCLDPAAEAVASASRRRLVDVMAALELDGLKIDFIDYIPPSLDRPRGRVIEGYLKELVGELRALKSDALIEFRQSYATPAMLPYATQFRAGDAPFDYLENLHRVAMIRILLGDRVPVHADPVYFNYNELPHNVSRHMIASLAGVPMVSLELGALKVEQLAVIRHWLGFYRDHLETFRTGRWSIEYYFDHLARISVETPEERIVILLNHDELLSAAAGAPSALHILNLTNFELALEKAAAFGCAGERMPGPVAPLGGRLTR